MSSDLKSDGQNLKHFRDHFYGSNVFILNSKILSTYLAKLGHPDTFQPEISELVKFLYHGLFDHAVDLFFPESNSQIKTRMTQIHPNCVFDGKIISKEHSAVTVDLARAGTLPSQICYEKLNYFLNPHSVRQDHFYISRKIDTQGKVVGVDVAGSKIGGSVEDKIVLFPDPMGATGSTIVEVYKHYRTKLNGSPKLMIALHLIVTPEYLKKVTLECPDLKILAIRLDRGLSSSDILKSPLGKYWSEEKGLDDHQYIVPGAGGLGEILNNSFC